MTYDTRWKLLRRYLAETTQLPSLIARYSDRLSVAKQVVALHKYVPSLHLDAGHRAVAAAAAAAAETAAAETAETAAAAATSDILSIRSRELQGK